MLHASKAGYVPTRHVYTRHIYSAVYTLHIYTAICTLHLYTLRSVGGSGGAVFNESKLYLTDLIELISAALFNNVTGVRGAAAAFLEQLVYAALIYLCMRPYATCV